MPNKLKILKLDHNFEEKCKLSTSFYLSKFRAKRFIQYFEPKLTL